MKRQRRERERDHMVACPFVGRDDVVLTPHTAFYSDFALYECQRIAAENLCHILLGNQDNIFRMVNEVDVTRN